MATSVRSRVFSEHLGAVLNPSQFVGKAPLKRPGSTSTPCVELVKQNTDAPPTQPDNWKRGMNLTAKVVAGLAVGTPIASGWSAAGYYPNNSTGQHAGLFNGAVRDKSGEVIGFNIVEQYNGIVEITERVVYFEPGRHGKRASYLNNGADYSTIQW